jgi:4-hydroxy-tetrahydrodipicolinate synthase
MTSLSLAPSIWTACITPFKDHGLNIDYTALEAILLRQERCGNGIILFGSTGEGLSLSDEEKEETLKFVMRLGLSVPILSAVPTYNLETAVRWLKVCQDYTLHGYLVSTPLYTRPGTEGQIQWFQAILTAAQKPVMLYNIPHRTGVSLSIDTLKALRDNPFLVSLKDSSGCLTSVFEYKRAAPRVEILCGDDHLMPMYAVLGSTGLVSVLSNVWPELMKVYVEQSLQGTWRRSFFFDALAALSKASNPIPVKALMRLLNMMPSDIVRLPLSKQDLPDLQPLRILQQAALEEAAYWNISGDGAAT